MRKIQLWSLNFVVLMLLFLILLIKMFKITSSLVMVRGIFVKGI